MNPCIEFRGMLERVLDARGRVPDGLASLGWHDHLNGCVGCRALLEAEEALEMLLASLPEPRLPQDLAQRVLARLEAERARTEQRLDSLLGLDAAAEAPAGLAARVLAGVRSSGADEERKLDALLALAGEVEIPDGLAGRVLAGVRTETGSDAGAATLARTGGGVLLSFPRRGVLRAAAALVFAAGAIGVYSLSRARVYAEPPEGLLAALDVLENWDVIASDDLALRTGIGFDPADEALLDFADPSYDAADAEAGR